MRNDHSVRSGEFLDLDQKCGIKGGEEFNDQGCDSLNYLSTDTKEIEAISTSYKSSSNSSLSMVNNFDKLASKKYV